MGLKFSDVVSKSDMIKISALLAVSAICWVWVWQEFQKPILPEGFDQNYLNTQAE